MRWPNKDPDEVLDYAVDWTARLAGDTISTSAFTVPAGLTMDSESATSQISTVWISGGTAGLYSIECTITTSGGRTMQESVRLAVVEV